VTALDGDDGIGSASFVVSINPVNDAPELSEFAALTVDQNASSAPIAFTVTDAETLPQNLTVSVVSSDAVLVPAGNFTVAGSGSSRTLVVTPATNRFGTATITVTLSDPDGGMVSRNFELTVRQVVFPPVITTQPQGVTVTNGAAVSFSVITSGTLPIIFQWKFNGAALPGETNAVLTMASVGSAQAGRYTVSVGNSAGEVTSSEAVLRVLVEPQITSVTYSLSGAEVSFTSTVNLSYTVQFKDAPDAPAWSELGTLQGTGEVMFFRDTSPAPTSRIYRVRVQ